MCAPPSAEVGAVQAGAGARVARRSVGDDAQLVAVGQVGERDAAVGIQAAAESSGTPLSVISRTPVAIRSAWVAAPGSRQSKRIGETGRTSAGPG